MEKSPIWWRRRTALKRCRTLESVFACIAVVWFVSGLAEAVRPKRICFAEECIHSASSLLKKLKSTEDPCEDFYKYACGKYLNRTTIPENKGWVDSYSETEDTVREQLKVILRKIRPERDHRHNRLPAAYFKACMNTDLIEKLDTKNIEDIAKEAGGWPVIVGDSWNMGDSWNLEQAIKKFRRLGLKFDSILSVSTGANMRNNTIRFIELDQPNLGLNREFLVNGSNDSLVLAYKSYMVDVAVLFGADPGKAARELGESLAFEMKLAEISWSIGKRSNYSEMYNLRTIKQLQELYSNIQWLPLINAVLPEGLQVDENEVINLAVPSFFSELDKLLSQTNKRIIANHMTWHTLSFVVDQLPEKFRKIKMKFITALTGKQEQVSRLVMCVDDVAERFSASVGSQYIKDNFKQESKIAAEKMFTIIQNAFRQMLIDAEWVDGTTKQKAIHKLDSMHTRMGYPVELLNDTILEEYYQGLNITDPDNYLKSSLMLNIFDADNKFKKLRLPVNRTSWTTFIRPFRVVGYLCDVANTITFAAGILQGQFFNGDRLNANNFGAIGSVFAHEISHGFDDIGRQFDGDGNLVNWWEEFTEKAYLERAKCIIEQYSNYTDEQVGLKLNGTNTQSENIADNVGIKAAYLAYKNWLETNCDEPKLPGLDKLTSQQLFWISAAQLHCSNSRDEDLRVKITSSYLAPSKYRVLVPFSNMQEFSDDFHCPVGSRMNPVKKCGVW